MRTFALTVTEFHSGLSVFFKRGAVPWANNKYSVWQAGCAARTFMGQVNDIDVWVPAKSLAAI